MSRCWSSTPSAPVGVAGGAIVEHDDLVPLLDQQTGDDGADVSRAADDERLHRATGTTSRSRWAAVSGLMSFTKAPIADSEPARYFNFPTARRIEERDLPGAARNLRSPHARAPDVRR